MFNTVKDHLLKSLFGENGGATHGDLVNQTRRSKLSQYIPYNYFDEENESYTCIDDTIGYIWECTPLYFVSKDVVTRLQKLLQMRFPVDVALSFHLYADPHIKDIIDAYIGRKVKTDEALTKSANEYGKFLIEGTKGLKKVNEQPVRNFRLWVSLKCFSGIPDDLRANVEEALSSCKLNPVRIDDKRLRKWLVRFFNSKDNVDVPMHIDKNLPIRKQLIQADTHIHFPHKGYTRIGKRYGACLTHFRVPDTTNSLTENKLLGGYMGVEDDTNQITSPFLYTIVVTFMDAEEEVDSKAKIVNGQSLVGKRARELARRMNEFQWITDLPEGEKRARVHQIMWIFDEDPEKLERSVSRAMRIAQDFDYEYMQETLLAPTLFISSLPLGYYNIKGNAEVIDRYRLLPTSSIAVLLPVQGDFTGSSRTIAGDMPSHKAPVVMTVGRKGQIQGFDVFDPASNNHNFFITAGSGAGKSVKLNHFVSNYYNSGAIVRLVDIGYSFQKNCMINKGRFLDIGEEYIVFNPFYSQSKHSDDLAMDIIASTNILAEMAYSASGSSLSEVEWTLLKNAANYVFTSGNRDDGIDCVRDYLTHLKKYEKDDPIIDLPSVTEAAKLLAFNLKDFTKKGMFGRYFNGPSNFNISDDEFVVLELQQLMEQKELFSVIVMQVVNSVTQDLYLSDRSTRRFVLFEEAAQYLKQQGHRDLSRLAAIIEEGYRRARKHKGSFGTVLQSILDLNMFGPIGQVLKSNAAYKFFLFSEDYGKARDIKLIEKEGLAFDLLESVRNNKPRYSEIYWETPFGQGIGRMVLDPWNYWMATSDADEFKAYQDLVNRGFTPAQALSHLSGVPL